MLADAGSSRGIVEFAIYWVLQAANVNLMLLQQRSTHAHSLLFQCVLYMVNELVPLPYISVPSDVTCRSSPSW